MWISILYKLKIFTPKGLYYFLGSIRMFGFNLMAIIRFYAKMKPEAIAVILQNKSISYHDLLNACQSYLGFAASNEHVQTVRKVAVIKRNGEDLIAVLAALSCLGKEIVLVNPALGEQTISTILAKAKIECCIIDDDIVLDEKCANFYVLPNPNLENSVNTQKRFKRSKQSKMTILTSGTTGVNVPVQRKMNPFKFLYPFFDLIKQLELLKVERMYLGVPICHGYGMAAFTMGLVMGKTIVLEPRFDAISSKCNIDSSHVDCLVLVPIMIKRLFIESNELTSVTKIISGGAPLTKDVIANLKSFAKIELFNLYGTSEVGVAFSDKVDLLKLIQIGRPLKGVKFRLGNQNSNEGELFVKSAWSHNNNSWIGTGDICAINEEGNMFWKSRKDEMIITGGENVYPYSLTDFASEIDGVIEAHTSVIDDADFGKRLLLFIKVKNPKLQETEIREILKKNLPRYLQPKTIRIVTDIPFNDLGKVPRRVVQDAI